MIAPDSARPEQPKPDEAQVNRILALAPAQRVARLASLPQPEFDSFRKALRRA
jgi:hypothetical protein